MFKSTYLIIYCLVAPMMLHAQGRIGTGEVKELYDQMCASCHGQDLRGGLGSALIGSEWKEVGKTIDFITYVQEGNLEVGMPSFKAGLDEKQIRSLEIYIEEKRQLAEREKAPVVTETDGVFEAGGYKFRLETVLEGMEHPWSIAFLSGNSGLVTERGGNLRQFENGNLLDPIQNVPEVFLKGQAGMLEVAVHPDYDQNKWVYLGYSHSHDGKSGMTKIVRGRILNNTWQDEETIFEAAEKFYRQAGQHWGTRFVFKDGYLFFSIGDRGGMEHAQDLTRPNGKIHRVHDDGRIPADNPFVNLPDAIGSIWSYGSRNPQGLDMHPITGDLWESEHGPRGGDEINLITRGKNYGWPIITYGMNYNGTPITDKTAAPGLEQPKHYWTPSIAVCGIDFYEGDIFPEWKNDLMVGGLSSQEVHRLVIENGKVVQSEIIVKDAGRVRDVASGPDGHLYLVLNRPDKIVRLVPVD